MALVNQILIEAYVNDDNCPFVIGWNIFCLCSTRSYLCSGIGAACLDSTLHLTAEQGACFVTEHGLGLLVPGCQGGGAAPQAGACPQSGTRVFAPREPRPQE